MLACSKVGIGDLLNLEMDTQEKKEQHRFDLMQSDEKMLQTLAIANEIDEIGSKIIQVCKNIIDFVLLNELMQDYAYISEALVGLYESHKKDLKNLKQIWAEYNLNNCLEKSFFDTDYPAYIGSLTRNYREKIPD